MANTFTSYFENVCGNMKMICGKASMDAGAGEVQLPLRQLYHAVVTPATATTSLEGIGFNVTTDGGLTLNTCPVGDTFWVVAYGR